jgi:hypothetical protein
MTVVTAQGPRVLAVLAQRVARLPEPGHSSYRAVGRAVPVILIISGGARSDSFTVLRRLRRAEPEGCRRAATRWNVQQRADIHSRRDGHPVHPQHTAHLGVIIDRAPALIRPVR